MKTKVPECTIRCIECGYMAIDARSLGNHQSQLCKGPAQLVRRQRIKRRCHPSQPVSVVHSVVAHGTKGKRDSKQKQDRAVSYTANCTWNRPSLAQSAATVLADVRRDREEEDRCAKECKEAGLATTSQDETVPAVPSAQPAAAGPKTTGLEDDARSETGSNVDFGGGGDDALSAADLCSIEESDDEEEASEDEDEGWDECGPSDSRGQVDHLCIW